MKICMAGEGAAGQTHLDALQNIRDVEIVSLVGGIASQTEAMAAKYGIPHWTTDLSAGLKQPGVEAVLLATPTPMHFAHAVQCLRAGKHVFIEIPIADNLRDVEELVRLQKETGLVAMGGHTRRFNPSHQWVHNRIKAGELKLLHLDVEAHIFRRTNTNMFGQPRSWVDHLLWHHAAHTVDLFQYQTGEIVSAAHAMQGPFHPNLKIAMDMNIQLKVPDGAICTLSLSFNNDGPLSALFRYICDNGTYIASFDDLVDGRGNRINVSNVAISSNGVELQDREFFAAIRENREPNASVAQLLPAMQVLDRLDRSLLQDSSRSKP